MKTISVLDDLRRQRRPVFLAAGYFDGVHLGHRKVIEATMARARSEEGEAWVLTFETHPLRVLNPPQAPPLLTSTSHRILLLERLGVDGCILLPFDRPFAELSPAQFSSRLLANSPPLREVFVGRNWHFGRNGRGTPASLSRLWRNTACRITVVRPVVRYGETVSSSRVRADILRGRLNEAATLLGRPFSVLGTVVAGEGLGRGLGFPTANLDPHNEVLPPFGVYAVKALLGGHLYDGVVNLGVRPSLPQVMARAGRKGAPTALPGVPVLELHLFDFRGDLYGQDIEVFFFEKIRDEAAFASAEELCREIENNCAQARVCLRSRPARVNSEKLKESLYTR